jgi:hypothetical protein
VHEKKEKKTTPRKKRDLQYKSFEGNLFSVTKIVHTDADTELKNKY